MSEGPAGVDGIGIDDNGNVPAPRIGVPELLDDAAYRLNLALDALVACGLAEYYLDGVVGEYRADAAAMYQAAHEIRAGHRRYLT